VKTPHINRLAAVAAFFLIVVTNQTCAAKKNSAPVLRGTINLILANDQGMVAITDSMVTDERPDGHGGFIYQQRPEPGEKLFQIDDRTVCTIAGFASAATPTLPEFVNSASEMMQRFKQRLNQQSQRNAQLTVKDKLRMLEGIFTLYIEGVANLRGDDRNYSFELLIAGYDPDGKPKIGGLVLKTISEASPTGSPMRATRTDQLFVSPVVGRNLAWLVAGIPNHATEILQHADAWAADAAVQAYVNSMKSGKPLTIEQMKELGISLKEHTARAEPMVGGPSQIAILANGRVQQPLEHPSFAPVATANVRFDIFAGASLSGGGRGSTAIVVFLPPPKLTLFFKNSFSHTTQPLDDGYFSGNHFEDCWLRYRSGTLQFDDSNQVVNSDLIIGPKLDRNSPTVKHLMKDFKWRHISFEDK